MTDTRKPDRHVVLVSGTQQTIAWVDEARRLIPLAAGRLAAAGLAPSACEVSVVLVDDEEMRALNLRYRGKDMPTDVLSFPQLEGDPAVPVDWPDALPFPIGDIVISMPRMIEQADDFGHSQAREFGFLLVHGLLHLLGYDHERPDEAAVMREKEEDLLAEAGLIRGADAR